MEFDSGSLRKPEVLSQLIHRLGHEIGNPLTSIISFATLMDRFSCGSETDPISVKDQRYYCRAILSEAWKVSALNERLVYLLSDRKPRITEFEPRVILDQTLSRLENRHGWDSSSIRLRFAEDLPTHIRGDPEQLGVVITELLLNAFNELRALGVSGLRTSEGPPIEQNQPQIFVDVGPTRDNDGNMFCEISISNRSRSIPLEDLSELFEPFVSCEPGTKQIGVGLTLCAIIMRRLGGTIELIELNGDNHNSCNFTATLTLPADSKNTAPPMGHTHSPRASIVRSPEQSTASVVIVEDDPAVRSAMSRILELSLFDKRIHCHCIDGPQALDWIEQRFPFDCMLCDLNLSGMSGRHVFETLQAKWPERLCSFAFITGEQERSETKRYLESCARPYLIKPFEPEQLLNIIEQLLIR